MPRFDIQRQQTIARIAQASDFGEGQGLVRLGETLGGIEARLKEKRNRDQEIDLENNLTQATKQWLNRVNELENEFPQGSGMYDRYAAEFSDYRQQFMQSVPENLKEKANARLNQLDIGFTRAVTDKQAQFTAQYQVGIVGDAIETAANVVARGELDYETANANAMSAIDAVAYATPAVRDQLKQQAQNQLGTAYAQQVLESEGFVVAWDEINAGGPAYDGMSPAAIENAKNSIEAKARVYVNRELKIAAQNFAHGYPVGNIAAEIEIADKLNFTEQSAELRKIQMLESEVQALVNMPLSKMQNAIDTVDQLMMEGRGTDEDFDRLQAFRMATQAKQEGLINYPYTWLNRSGYLGERFNTLDMAADFTDEMAKRRHARAAVLQKDGIDIDLFQDGEINAFVQQSMSVPPEEQVAMLSVLSAQLEDSEIGKVAVQMAPKDTLMAAAMVTTDYAPDVSRDMLLGRRREVQIPGKETMRAKFHELGGNAFPDPVAQSQAFEAFMSLYREAAFNMPLNQYDAQNVMDEVAESQMKRLMGETVIINQRHILPVRTSTGRFLDEDQTKKLLDSIELADIVETHGDMPRTMTGEAVDVEAMFQSMRMVSVGENLYSFVDQTGRYVADSGGRPFEFDMSILHDHIMSRPTVSRRTNAPRNVTQ